MLIRKLQIGLLLMCVAGPSLAQTDVSLFWRKDSAQRLEIISEEADQYKKVGHHGPAVENKYMALRLYFNNSGAIDVYSKSGKLMELTKYLWYPDQKAQAAGYGCDEYLVGSGVGLGGINLWDGEKVIKLVATKGREARVGKTKKGAYAEMLAKGVDYKGKPVDILVRITMFDKERYARIDARCTSGDKVQFVTGVNYHKGQQVDYKDGYIAVWGIHPADVSKAPIPIGGGMRYNLKNVEKFEQTKDMIQFISKPDNQLYAYVISASVKEEKLNTPELFFEYVKTMKVK